MALPLLTLLMEFERGRCPCSWPPFTCSLSPGPPWGGAGSPVLVSAARSWEPGGCRWSGGALTTFASQSVFTVMTWIFSTRG